MNNLISYLEDMRDWLESDSITPTGEILDEAVERCNRAIELAESGNELMNEHGMSLRRAVKFLGHEHRDCQVNPCSNCLRLLTEFESVANTVAREARVATAKKLEELAYQLPHEQVQDPAEGMIPNETCAHCQILLTVIPAVLLPFSAGGGKNPVVVDARESGSSNKPVANANPQGSGTSIHKSGYDPDLAMAFDTVEAPDEQASAGRAHIRQQGAGLGGWGKDGEASDDNRTRQLVGDSAGVAGQRSNFFTGAVGPVVYAPLLWNLGKLVYWFS